MNYDTSKVPVGYTYDDRKRVVTFKSETGLTKFYEYDDNNHVTMYASIPPLPPGYSIPERLMVELEETRKEYEKLAKQTPGANHVDKRKASHVVHGITQAYYSTLNALFNQYFKAVKELVPEENQEALKVLTRRYRARVRMGSNKLVRTAMWDMNNFDKFVGMNNEEIVSHYESHRFGVSIKESQGSKQ